MDNNLSTLPSSLRRCRSLRLLYVDGNRLTAVPPSAVDLPRLDRLGVSNNRLRVLPAQPFSSRNARVLFDGNPDLNAVPFTFGCRQSSLNARVAAASRAFIDHDDGGGGKTGIVWTFENRGCGSYREPSLASLLSTSIISNHELNCYRNQTRKTGRKISLGFGSAGLMGGNSFWSCRHSSSPRRPSIRGPTASKGFPHRRSQSCARARCSGSPSSPPPTPPCHSSW